MRNHDPFTSRRPRPRDPAGALRRAAALGLAAGLAGCGGIQSALDPAGPEAGSVFRLTLIMAAGGALIWLAVIGAFLYALRPRRHTYSETAAGRLILAGGVAFPVLTLGALLGTSLWLMPELRPWLAAAEDDRLRIEVTGHQFWWEVVYRPAAGRPAVVAANEVRLPQGEQVEILLRAQDVIHSFWIPALAGKMDLIPGRENRLTLAAVEAGSFRGVCAEFCGTSHALMGFPVEVMPPDAFAAWLEARTRPAARAGGAGLETFLTNGCGACHTVAGTPARGEIGPDLSHVASRTALAAGVLPMTPEALARFIAAPDVVKPGVGMPAYGMLPEAEMAMLVDYLWGLR